MRQGFNPRSKAQVNRWCFCAAGSQHHIPPDRRPYFKHPAHALFIQSWCGGETSEYAKVCADRDKLIKERDTLQAKLDAVPEKVEGFNGR